MGAHHREQIVARMALGHAEVAFRRSQGIKPLQFAIDQHCRGGIGLDYDTAATLGKRDLPGRRLALGYPCRRRRPLRGPKQKARLTWARVPNVPIDSLGLRNNLEAALGTADRLCAPKHEYAAFA